jgi:hypothetical protein
MPPQQGYVLSLVLRTSILMVHSFLVITTTHIVWLVKISASNVRVEMQHELASLLRITFKKQNPKQLLFHYKDFTAHFLVTVAKRYVPP